MYITAYPKDEHWSLSYPEVPKLKCLSSLGRWKKNEKKNRNLREMAMWEQQNIVVGCEELEAKTPSRMSSYSHSTAHCHVQWESVFPSFQFFLKSQESSCEISYMSIWKMLNLVQINQKNFFEEYLVMDNALVIVGLKK